MVLLLFLPFSTTSPHLDTHLACKLCLFSINLVCFIYFFTSNLVLGLFSTSSGLKSPRLRACSHHHLHKPSNEAGQCPTPTNNGYDSPTIDGDDEARPHPTTANDTQPIPIPTNSVSPTSTLGLITVKHSFCTP